MYHVNGKYYKHYAYNYQGRYLEEKKLLLYTVKFFDKASKLEMDGTFAVGGSVLIWLGVGIADSSGVEEGVADHPKMNKLFRISPNMERGAKRPSLSSGVF